MKNTSNGIAGPGEGLGLAVGEGFGLAVGEGSGLGVAKGVAALFNSEPLCALGSVGALSQPPSNANTRTQAARKPKAENFFMNNLLT